MIKVSAESLKVGDVIMPPAREVQLWMARHAKEHGMSEAALHLTITEIYEAEPDRRGRWLMFRTEQSAEWNAGHSKAMPFKFKARPETPWPKVECA